MAASVSEGSTALPALEGAACSACGSSSCAARSGSSVAWTRGPRRCGEPEAEYLARVAASTRVVALATHACAVDLWDRWRLALELTFAPEDIQPVFSGACWAGTVVWSASLCLCDHLRALDARGLLAGRKVVELGAGLGVPAMAASLLGAAPVFATEQPPLPALLRRNVAAVFGAGGPGEGCAPPRVATLDWEADSCEQFGDGAVDLILVSDCVYAELYGESWRALADCIRRLSTPGVTRTLNCLERRNAGDGVDDFLNYARSIGIESRLIDKPTGPEGESLELYEMALPAAPPS
jgi:predicted nicotinamide N-methyase